MFEGPLSRCESSVNRILLGMAIVNYLLFGATVYCGFLSEPPVDVNRPGSGAFGYHLPLGLGTGLYTMFAQCMVFTYFLGTTRWVRETAAAYRLDASFATRSRACRSRAMVMAVVGILLVVGAVATGAGAHTRTWPTWLHSIGPFVTFSYLLLAYRVQYGAIEEHMDLTNAVMDEVNRIRVERGLAPIGDAERAA